MWQVRAAAAGLRYMVGRAALRQDLLELRVREKRTRAYSVANVLLDKLPLAHEGTSSAEGEGVAPKCPPSIQRGAGYAGKDLSWAKGAAERCIYTRLVAERGGDFGNVHDDDRETGRTSLEEGCGVGSGGNGRGTPPGWVRTALRA